jgi:hypothetical protein
VLLQQEIRRHASPPLPSYASTSGHFVFDPEESSEELDNDQYHPPKKEWSLATDHTVPPFWGVVKVNDFGGVPNHNGVEHDNAMQGMLSRDTYLSCSTNWVFVRESAQLAMDHEWCSNTPYIPSRHSNTTSMYERTIRGLPLEPEEVKKLRTIYHDGKRRFTDQSQVEAYLLLWELYIIANRVIPQHHDSTMNYLLQPEGFDDPPPQYFP